MSKLTRVIEEAGKNRYLWLCPNYLFITFRYGRIYKDSGLPVDGALKPFTVSMDEHLDSLPSGLNHFSDIETVQIIGVGSNYKESHDNALEALPELFAESDYDFAIIKARGSGKFSIECTGFLRSPEVPKGSDSFAEAQTRFMVEFYKIDPEEEKITARDNPTYSIFVYPNGLNGSAKPNQNAIINLAQSYCR